MRVALIKIAVLLLPLLIAIASPAQGIINFMNGPSTIFRFPNDSGGGAYVNPVGSFYFALLTSPVGANTFTFAGVYGTNLAVAGRFNGGFGMAVNGWAPGTARDFEVAGWSANLGMTFNPTWLTGTSINRGGFFGVSSIGTGEAGGNGANGPVIALNIFGGATGIQSGFNLLPIAPVWILPQLDVEKVGPNLVLSWSTNAFGFTLQSTTNLISPDWHYIFPQTVVVNGQNTVTNAITGIQQFFRLSQ